MRIHRDPRYRETHVIVPDEFFERAGVTMGPLGPTRPLPPEVARAVMDVAYQASPQAFIDQMREKKRRNYRRRFPWLRAKP